MDSRTMAVTMTVAGHEKSQTLSKIAKDFVSETVVKTTGISPPHQKSQCPVKALLYWNPCSQGTTPKNPLLMMPQVTLTPFTYNCYILPAVPSQSPLHMVHLVEFSTYSVSPISRPDIASGCESKRPFWSLSGDNERFDRDLEEVAS